VKNLSLESLKDSNLLPVFTDKNILILYAIVSFFSVITWMDNVGCYTFYLTHITAAGGGVNAPSPLLLMDLQNCKSYGHALFRHCQGLR